MALTVVHLIGIPLTGTSVNPARSLGPALIIGGDALSQVWLFIVAARRRSPRRSRVARGDSRTPTAPAAGQVTPSTSSRPDGATSTSVALLHCANTGRPGAAPTIQACVMSQTVIRGQLIAQLNPGARRLVEAAGGAFTRGPDLNASGTPETAIVRLSDSSVFMLVHQVGHPGAVHRASWRDWRRVSSQAR